MASDDWVEDVRRWYFAGTMSQPVSAGAERIDVIELGYEAANPALQSRHWPDAPRDAAAVTPR